MNVGLELNRRDYIYGNKRSRYSYKSTYTGGFGGSSSPPPPKKNIFLIYKYSYILISEQMICIQF